MRSLRAIIMKFATVLVVAFPCLLAPSTARPQKGSEFGPVVRAYLGYLKNEQEVVDDRVSRREISQAYYRRNSNRIRALREMAMRLARQTRNDYLPELEAVTRDEFGLLFQEQPRPESLKIGEIRQNTFRFLGTVRSNETFYVFARLDPYEQSELLSREPEKPTKVMVSLPSQDRTDKAPNRPRRVVP